MARFIGIQHRVKMTAEGESHPTRVAIIDGDHVGVDDLKTEQNELEFVQNELRHGDNVAMALGGSGDYLAYAIYRQAAKVGASIMRLPTYALKRERDGTEDSAITGLERTLKSKTAKDRTSEDHLLLAHLARDKPQLFYPLADTDADLILARESWRALWESMQARTACEQRLRQFYIGRAFTRPDGMFPEGGIEKGFDALKASDPILAVLRKEEAKRERELTQALEDLDVYAELFKPIPGVGPKIAGRILAAVIDIRRFTGDPSAELMEESRARSREHAILGRLQEDWDAAGTFDHDDNASRIRAIAHFKREQGRPEETHHLYEVLREMELRGELRKTKQGGTGAAKLKAYMGVHVLPDGTFARRRRGQVANWHGDARQALFLLGDQFNRRPDSYWGQYLRKMKANLRLKHPEPIMVETQNGKVKRYTDGHIHKMATWRTLSRFVEQLHRDWWELEESRKELLKAA